MRAPLHYALATAALAAACVTLRAAGASARDDGPQARVGGIDPATYGGALHWRSIGPYRGGRAVAVAGTPDGRTYYFGAVGGGVWKTANAGATWRPLTDALGVASFGALAVAPSDADVVYAGSGEADMRSDIVHGDGLYRSSDAGATWTRAGLDDSRQIGRILVDPHDPRTLLVAALGHAYGPNQTRGVFRSRDGGATWQHTLYRDADTGAIDLAADSQMRVVYASLWQTRRPPWSVYPPSYGAGSGLYKSLDGGATWTALRGTGLPVAGLGKIGLAVAPSAPNRVYAIVDAKKGGLYRSDDAGATFRLVDADERLWDRGWYFCHVAVDPKNPDLVYVSDTSVYRSSDGGAHFTAIKGSPDGDDFHQLWIDPVDPSRMVLGSDQGASVSLDGARTWSSWFNQPTGQFYHVAAGAGFPYRLFGAQQDNGAAAILSRSDHRGIEERDWRPISAGSEAGTVAPDPHDPNLVYASAGFGSDGVVREDLRTDQTEALSPVAGSTQHWRSEWTMPLAFGPDGALYASYQNIFRSRDRGRSWQRISGDLARRAPGVPATLDAATAADTGGTPPLGLVYALAPSPLDARRVWAGTDDGLVYVTRDDGATWRDVTPPGTDAWTHVDGIDASHADPQTAYVALDRHRLDDDRPRIAVTHDGGTTWRDASAGIPDGSFVNAVREDPVRRGLLYAGTETGVFVSFDDGASWRSLRLDMPAVSVRDLAIHDGDLAIATHGRGFYILDDLAPLRAIAEHPEANAGLFALPPAIRTRPGDDEAEVTPPETPAGENPPNGAFLDYALPPGTSGPVRLSVATPAGDVLRSWSSADAVRDVDPATVPFPAYWIEKARTPAATAGLHRFVWDFRVDDAHGPFAAPGTYVVRLEAAGRTFVQSLVLRRDPRVHASDADLAAQTALARDVHALGVRFDAADARAALPPAARTQRRALGDLERAIESADGAPLPSRIATWHELERALHRALASR